MGNAIQNIMQKACRGGYTEGLLLCARALDGKEAAVLITPNAEMLAKATRDRRLATLISRGDILFPDGVGAFLAMKRLGVGAAERTCGIELCERFLANLSVRKKGTRVFLLGGKKGVAEKAAELLQKKYSGIKICGVHHGYFDPSGEENDTVVRLIKESNAEIVVVCMGFPRQETWMLRNRHRLSTVRLMMGLGGSLDIWSGSTSRAPRAIRSAGLEWAYRAVKAPSRVSRLPYLAGFVIELAMSQGFRSR